MGKVTVFSISNCPFCAKAKALLTAKGVEYVEINIEDYPEKRKDMLKAAKALSVPQIFFNDKHIGGADDLLQLDDEDKLDDMLAKVEDENGPKSDYLLKPTGEPVKHPEPSPRKDESVTCGSIGTFGPAELAFHLDTCLPKGKSSFLASEIVDHCVERYELSSREEGVAIAAKLNEYGLVTAVDGKSKLADNAVWFYFSVRHQPFRLNNMRPWNDRVDEPLLLITALKKQLGKVVTKHRDSDGLVDYVALAEDPDFYDFEEACCELQAIDMAAMPATARKAFVINVYNTAIVHAFAKVGAPKGGLQRSKFFPGVGYIIGGAFYSFDTLESGVLRGNRKGPGLHLSNPIKKGDKRIKSALKDDEVDCRIHTALNCGSKSCPPVKKFSKEAVDEELEVVATAFFQQEDNFSIKGKVISLNMILKWYGRDFGKNQAEVVTTISQWLPDNQQETVRHLVESGDLVVKYNFYDWSTDAKRTRPLSLSGGNSSGGGKCSIA